MGQPVTPAAAAPRPAIISPLIDALCVGGLSLLLLLPLLLSGRADLVIVGLGMQAWIAALVNMPHFMASYRLVYRNRETINAHRWAAIYVPLILIAYIAFAVWQSRETDLYVSILMTVQGAYLAWHYTGQAWGMMATYTYLDGRSFQHVERRLIRGGLYLLLAWHVAWFFRWGFGETRFGPLLESLYFILSVLSAVALVAGGWLQREVGAAHIGGVVFDWQTSALGDQLVKLLAQRLRIGQREHTLFIGHIIEARGQRWPLIPLTNGHQFIAQNKIADAL